MRSFEQSLPVIYLIITVILLLSLIRSRRSICVKYLEANNIAMASSSIILLANFFNNSEHLLFEMRSFEEWGIILLFIIPYLIVQIYWLKKSRRSEVVALIVVCIIFFLRFVVPTSTVLVPYPGNGKPITVFYSTARIHILPTVFYIIGTFIIATMLNKGAYR